MNKIDLSKIHPLTLCDCVGFVYHGSVFIHLHDAMGLIGLRLEDGASTIYNWKTTHYFFRQALGLLHINDDDYELPLNHIPIKRSGPITDYQANLPLYIKDVVLIKMASFRNNFESTYPKINMILSEFKLCKNLNKADNEYYEKNKLPQVATYLNNERNNDITMEKITNQEKEEFENGYKLPQVATYLQSDSINTIDCVLDGKFLRGFVKEFGEPTEVGY